MKTKILVVGLALLVASAAYAKTVVEPFAYPPFPDGFLSEGELKSTGLKKLSTAEKRYLWAVISRWHKQNARKQMADETKQLKETIATMQDQHDILVARIEELMKVSSAEKREAAAELAKKPTTRKSEPKKAEEDPNVITTRLAGKGFDGWTPGKVWTLTNGQQWRQVGGMAQIYSPTLYGKKVTISKFGDKWLIAIDGVKDSVEVERVR